MSTIFLLALIAVTAVIVAVLLDTVIAVSRPASWESGAPRLFAVQTVDRRTHDLPFIGTERRGAAQDDAAAQETVRHEAA
jgi:hypothetical protein